jgi:hypothetical protein
MRGRTLRWVGLVCQLPGRISNRQVGIRSQVISRGFSCYSQPGLLDIPSAKEFNTMIIHGEVQYVHTTYSHRGISYRASLPPSSSSHRAPSKADPNTSNRTSPTSQGVPAVFEVSPERISSAVDPDTERLGHSPVCSRSWVQTTVRILDQRGGEGEEKYDPPSPTRRKFQ